MGKLPLIGVSICAVVLLVLASLCNVVGYQTVQASQQNLVKERINQRELLFQTIVDISNNKGIQRIILKSQMKSGIFLLSEIPVVTKQQIKQMYLVSLMFSKFISKSRIQSIVEMNQVSNQDIQKKMSAVLEKDATLKDEITQLQNSKCDCENENTTDWDSPIICGILLMLFIYHVVMATVIIKIMETIHNKPIIEGVFYVIGMYQLIQSFALSYLLNLMC